MCFGGGSDSNDELIELQEEQAEEARKKEEERQKRIDKGLADIKAAFEGKEITTTAPVTYEFSGQKTGKPAGFKYHKGKPAKRLKDGSVRRAVPPTLVGPDGKVYKAGDTVNYSKTTGTGKFEGGFDDEFYDSFTSGITDYYLPQVADQYADAKKETTYGLARAGTLKSSAAVEEAADLFKQDELNRANVIAEADTSTAALRSRVAGDRAKAEAQLYATENPDVAVNQALAAVRNISLEQPSMTPLGEIFKIAASGGANALTGYRNQKSLNKLPEYLRSGGTSIIG